MRPVKQFIGVIGYPLKHSVSPYFQQAALDYYKLDMRYEAREVKAEDLSYAIDQLRQPQNLGASITVPYKEAVLRLIDGVDDFAVVAGGAKTARTTEGRV